MAVSLSKPVDLTNTRAIAAGAMLAYANETLQAIKHLNAGTAAEFCTYVGPCAIGVSLTPEQQARFDGSDAVFGSKSIYTLVEDDEVRGDRRALDEMQLAHDGFARCPTDEEEHLHFLIVTTFYAMGLDQ